MIHNRNNDVWPFMVPPPTARSLILDNMGIILSLEMLEGWPDFREAQRRLFGTNWLSRFWMGRIYPILRPKRYAELRRKFEEQRQKMQRRFLVAVLEKAKEATS